MAEEEKRRSAGPTSRSGLNEDDRLRTGVGFTRLTVGLHPLLPLVPPDPEVTVRDVR